MANSALEQRSAAQRLARHPDRLAARATHQRGPVGVEGVQVDAREWRLEFGAGLLEALMVAQVAAPGDATAMQ